MQRGEVTFPRTDQAGNWTKVACCCSYAGPVVCGALCTFPIPYSDDDDAFGDDDGGVLQSSLCRPERAPSFLLTLVPICLLVACAAYGMRRRRYHGGAYASAAPKQRASSRYAQPSSAQLGGGGSTPYVAFGGGYADEDEGAWSGEPDPYADKDVSYPRMPQLPQQQLRVQQQQQQQQQPMVGGAMANPIGGRGAARGLTKSDLGEL